MRFPSRPILYASGFNAESRQAAIVAYWYRKKSPDSVRNAASEEDSFISAKWGLFAISQASCFRAASRDTKSNGSNRFFGRARRRSAIGQWGTSKGKFVIGVDVCFTEETEEITYDGLGTRQRLKFQTGCGSRRMSRTAVRTPSLSLPRRTIPLPPRNSWVAR